MTIGRSGVITFVAFPLVFWLFVRAGQSGDLMWRGIEWAAILLLSGFVLIRLYRGRAHGTDYASGLPQSFRRCSRASRRSPSQPTRVGPRRRRHAVSNTIMTRELATGGSRQLDTLLCRCYAASLLRFLGLSCSVGEGLTSPWSQAWPHLEHQQ